jgi:hypothetical protein
MMPEKSGFRKHRSIANRGPVKDNDERYIHSSFLPSPRKWGGPDFLVIHWWVSE